MLPAEIGLGVDYVASVRQAGAGDSWEPERLWDYYTGGSELDPVVTVSEMAMADYVMQLATASGAQGRDGGVRFDHQRVEVVKPRPGRTIDPQQAQDAITTAFLSKDRTAHIDLVPSAPSIDDADVQRGRADLRQPGHVRAGGPRPRGPDRPAAAAGLRRHALDARRRGRAGATRPGRPAGPARARGHGRTRQAGRRVGRAGRRPAAGGARPARRDLRAGVGRGRLHGRADAARGRAGGTRRGRPAPAELHDRGRPGAGRRAPGRRSPPRRTPSTTPAPTSTAPCRCSTGRC